MRQRRIDRGALNLASAEVKFDIDPENHDPLNIGMLSEQNLFLLDEYERCFLSLFHPNTHELQPPLSF